MFLDPNDPEVISTARTQGITDNFIEAAKLSPVYKLAVKWKVAFPLHPEFRTLPMVWYVPPLSPFVHTPDDSGREGEELDSMRIPLKYLANMLTAGDEAPVRAGLKKLVALRKYMRSIRVEKAPDLVVLDAAGMTVAMAEEMYRLFAIAKFQDRFVVPTVRREGSENLYISRGEFGFPTEDYEEQ